MAMNPESIEAAATLVAGADALLITAGAGMGVDSGLPDFRGDQGFWNAYPLYRDLGVNFIDMANPENFARDPAFGWGFYGHRLELYRATQPHDGFRILRDWMRQRDDDAFVVTSNVDGQFRAAGFPDARICEVHGSIHHLQCTVPCCAEIWFCEEAVPVDVASMRAGHVPRCPHCGAVARPNILMFGDWNWVSGRTDAQDRRFREFLEAHRDARVAVIEMGAGEAIPTIRRIGESVAARLDAGVIRINPREPDIGDGHVGLACGALEALQAIDAVLTNWGMSTSR